MTEGGDDLPDKSDDGGVRWAPGALDGVFGHHSAGGDDAAQVEKLVTLVRRASSGIRKGRARLELYQELRDTEVLHLVDPVLERLDGSSVAAVGSWLVHEGTDRGPVKFGIALLGRGHTDQDRESLRILGRHDEFTLYAAVALANTTDDPDVELLDLARHVDGWGRIQIVERLAGSGRPDVKDWLLRGGFRNSIMDEYTAWIAATTGDLRSALAGPVDDELLDNAVALMTALISGGPARDIADYADGVEVVERLLTLLGDVRRAAEHYHLVAATADLVATPEGLQLDLGWTDDVRARTGAQASVTLADPRWRELAERELRPDRGWEFARIEAMAHAVGVDTMPVIQERLALAPGAHDWHLALRRVDEPRVDELLELATRTLPLDELGTGPAEESGVGPSWQRHSSLQFIVQGLERFPGRGWPLVRTGLASPAIPVRNSAIRTLASWGRRAWPDTAESDVRAALDAEPDDDVRLRLERLLAGQPLDD